MDIAKIGSGQVVHMPTSLMPGVIFWGFCSEQMNIPGVPKPTYFGNDFVRSGIVQGTNIGYSYVWGWLGSAVDDFAAAVYQLTQAEHVLLLTSDLTPVVSRCPVPGPRRALYASNSDHRHGRTAEPKRPL
jgi:hypothetical protein